MGKFRRFIYAEKFASEIMVFLPEIEMKSLVYVN